MKPRDTKNIVRRLARTGERGVVAILAALLLLALIGLILLAVQVGDIGMVRGMLQGSADEAALAGALQLDGTSDGLTQARTKAESLVAGGRNFPQAVNEGRDLDITGPAYDTGVWSFNPPRFTPSNVPEDVNAVRVIGMKTAGQNNEISMMLGGLLGSPDTVAVARTGIAAIGSPDTLPCGLEVPLAACDDNIESKCGTEITWVTSNDNVDNACWTTFTSHPANASDTRKFINNCSTVPKVSLGEQMYVLNGNATGGTYKPLQDALKTFMNANSGSISTKKDSTNGRVSCTSPNVRLPNADTPSCKSKCGATTFGPPIDINNDGVVNKSDCGMTAAIPVVDSAACTSHCNQTQPLKGYALIVITQVDDNSNPKVVKGIPLCGIVFPDTRTGPGPCSPETPLSCAKTPVLVNSSL